MADYKKLCAELVEIWDNTSDPDYYDFGDAARYLVTRARDALAEPEPEGPTDEELMKLAREWNSGYESIELEFIADYARAVLARWGNSSAPQPIPVSERLPGPEDSQ